jgi:integrase
MKISINFSVRKNRESADGKSPIYVRFTIKNKRVDLSTGIFFPQDQWDENKQHVKGKIPGAKVLNERLDKMETEILDIFIKKDFNNQQNTAWNYHKHLRRVLNLAISMDCIDKNPYSKFKVGLAETHREILSMEELKRLEDKSISIERLSVVRDIFVFACYTGLSVFDIAKLSRIHLKQGADGKEWIIIDQTKTNNRCRIPILPKAKEILKKYENYPKTIFKDVLLPVLTNQKMNSYLKELGDICGISKSITMHIAWHTFATSVTLGNGVPIETVSKILGHTSLKTTQIYAKILDKKISEDMDLLEAKLSKAKTQKI